MDAKDIDISATYPHLNGQNASHRSPYEAGANDRYYGHAARPSFAYRGRTYTEAEMTNMQIALYHQGYDEQTDRKDWE